MGATGQTTCKLVKWVQQLSKLMHIRSKHCKYSKIHTHQLGARINDNPTSMNIPNKTRAIVEWLQSTKDYHIRTINFQPSILDREDILFPSGLLIDKIE